MEFWPFGPLKGLTCCACPKWQNPQAQGCEERAPLGLLFHKTPPTGLHPHCRANALSRVSLQQDRASARAGVLFWKSTESPVRKKPSGPDATPCGVASATDFNPGVLVPRNPGLRDVSPLGILKWPNRRAARGRFNIPNRTCLGAILAGGHLLARDKPVWITLLSQSFLSR